MNVRPPQALKKVSLTERHGNVCDDPYAWLKDPNWQAVLANPDLLDRDIRDYLDAENDFTGASFEACKDRESEIFSELKGRLTAAEASVPTADGPWAYGHSYRPGEQYPVYQRRSWPSPAAKKSPEDDLMRADDDIVLDVAALAEGLDFCRVFMTRHSPDHRYLAYTVDRSGAERYQLKIRDLNTGFDLPDEIYGVGPTFVWGAGSRSLYYAELDEHHRAKWVKRHLLGETTNELLYTEADPGFFLKLSLSSSRDFLLLAAYNHVSSETHVLDLASDTSRFRCIEKRAADVLYEVSHHSDGAFIILVHEGDAKDGTIYTAPIKSPQRDYWRELVPYHAGCLIEEILVLKGHLVRLVMEQALPRIIVRSLTSGSEHAVTFAEEAYFVALVPGYEFATSILRFTYSSPSTPEQTYDYHLDMRERIQRKAQQIPSGHNPADYEVKRLYCSAQDGAQIPVTLLRHKQHNKPGDPLLLYGYGAYGRSLPASFSPHRLTLVNRGVSYAVAHIRGGKDQGYGWYEAAKLLQKKTTFTDFISCAEYLCDAGITQRGRIIGHGASAGGMLIGAVANLAPTLFLGLIADVPFVDVLNTMWDKDLPLTPPEWPEWGNPIESREAHDYIASYSPYDNVECKDYPHLLVLAGLTDPRVTYWEPAKWVARLRERKTDKNLLLFTVNLGAGHAGASGRFDILHKVARIYTYSLEIIGPLARLMT